MQQRNDAEQIHCRSMLYSGGSGPGPTRAWARASKIIIHNEFNNFNCQLSKKPTPHGHAYTRSHVVTATGRMSRQLSLLKYVSRRRMENEATSTEQSERVVMQNQPINHILNTSQISEISNPKIVQIHVWVWLQFHRQISLKFLGYIDNISASD